MIYEATLENLRVEYSELMKYHRQLNTEWKTKRTWQAFTAEYAKITTKVLQERSSFLEKLKTECDKVQEDVESLLERLTALFSEEDCKHNKDIENYRQFLIERTHDNPEDLMRLIILCDSQQDD